MISKIIIISSIILIVGAVIGLIYFSSYQPTMQVSSEHIDAQVIDNIYPGPIRPTDDENVFRQTGMTQPRSSN